VCDLWVLQQKLPSVCAQDILRRDMDKILGLDYGDSRTGVAISDALGWTAQPLDTIDMKIGAQKVKTQICELISTHKIKTVVVGFPLNMNGSVGPRAEKTAEFILSLEVETKGAGVEFVKWDERLTTVIANRTMHELGIKTKNKRGLVDKIAAVQILQSYLDTKVK